MKFFYRQKRRGLYAWPNVYYIGTIQGIVDAEMPEGSHIAADLVTSDTSIDHVDEGIYDINVYDRDARLFLWEHLEEYRPIPIIEYAIPGEVPLDATHVELMKSDPHRRRVVDIRNTDHIEELEFSGYTLTDYLIAVHMKYGMIVDAEDSSTLEEAEELYEAKGTI
jgi:hypothetical protein